MKQTIAETALDILIAICKYPAALVMLGLCLTGFLTVEWVKRDAKIVSRIDI